MRQVVLTAPKQFEVREVPNPTDDNTKKIYVRTRPGNRNNKKNR